MAAERREAGCRVEEDDEVEDVECGIMMSREWLSDCAR